MTVIDDYLAKHATTTQRAELERVRAIVLQLVPEAEETISYAIPTLKYKGKFLFYFAPFKDHMSVFPGAGPIAELSPRLTKFKVAKGTIQFTEQNPLPEALIKDLVAARLKIINA